MPDIVTMAKGIGNGLPLAAVVTTPEIAQVRRLQALVCPALHHCSEALLREFNVRFDVSTAHASALKQSSTEKAGVCETPTDWACRQLDLHLNLSPITGHRLGHLSAWPQRMYRSGARGI